ncbi:hypothetical protein [Haloprofundus halobius]|uniref:hypothetical protein n=1 Tax=Haloprofundus halobius TaxID=2876194 RepID=UPI001CCCBF56|nr:hypothetical protein [Haloprofundus halobius]
MSVTVSQGSLLTFLENEASGSRNIRTTGNGLCLLIGETAIRNLRSALISRSIEPKQVAELETLQNVARTLLEEWSRPRVLNERVKGRLVKATIEAAREGEGPSAIRYLAERVGSEWDDDTYDALIGELETYWRSTDAGSDHDYVRSVIETMDDPYGKYRSKKALEAFDALHSVLQRRTEALPEGVYLSESHLIKRARERLEQRWETVFSYVDWIAVGSIKALDNGALRFITELVSLPNGPDVHFFFNEGTSELMRDRIQRAGVCLDSPPEEALEGTSPAFVDSLIQSASTGQQPVDSIDAIDFVEAPDARREFEQVAREIERRCDQPHSALTPGDFLLVVREVTPYLSTLEDVFTTHELPFHVEAQRPTAQVIAYRLVKATLDLVAASAEKDLVTYHDLVDPLRLGYCPLSDAPGSWPVDDASFLELEERLHGIQSEYGNVLEEATDGRTVSEWESVVDEIATERGGVWHQLLYFLDWVLELGAESPENGTPVETVLRGLVEEHLMHTAGAAVRSSSGPGVDTTRTDVDEKHPTYRAKKAVLDKLAKVRQYYNYIVDLELGSPGWELAAQALGETLGTDQYSVPNRDGNAVRVVIPANTYFLDAEHLFIVGLGADEFPSQQPNPTFLHERFYEAVWEYSKSSEDEVAPFLYVPAREEVYQRELDDFEATLRATKRSVTFSQHYRDADGDEVTWSPFVDAVATAYSDDDSQHRRIRLSQWLPGPGWYGNWMETTNRATMRDRLRLAVHHLREGVVGEAFYPRLSSESIADGETLIRLLLSVDGEEYEDVKPLHQRFSSPQLNVTVATDESTFDGAVSLFDIVGNPVRAHEVDLFSQCQLKYYFYQFLFSVDGTTLTRDSWPTSESPYAQKLFPSVPAVLQNHYAPQSYREAMGRLIRQYLPDRQADLGVYADVSALRADFQSWNENDVALSESVFQTLVGEYLTVTQEVSRGVVRQWEWVEGEEREVSIGDHTVLLPAHRRDVITNNDDSEISVFGSARQGGARAALKNCWSNDRDGALRGERSSDVCQSCGKRERCTIPTKGVLDTRARATAVATNQLGALILDRYQSSPSGRQGFVRDDGRFEPAPHEQNLERINASMWSMRTNRWGRDLRRLLDEMSVNPDGTVEYSVGREFVENGGCEGCVFRDLCLVPNHFDEGVSN